MTKAVDLNAMVWVSQGQQNRKSTCFVTVVLGADKILAGLIIAASPQAGHKYEHVVFLSGNGPLVIVLREALATDQVA